MYKIMDYHPKAAVVQHVLSPSFACESHVLEVHWEPTHALATTVKDPPESEALLAAHMLRVKACHATSLVHCDLGLSSLQLQGHESRQQVRAMPWSPRLAAKVHIHTLQPVHPGNDMMPTGRFAIHMQRGMPHIIRLDGTFSSSLTKSRLDKLYKRYSSGKDQRPSSISADFAEAFNNLLARYKDGFEASAGNKTKLCNHWATPDVYMLALEQGLNIHTERFASPLIYTPHLQAYFSRYSDDKLFGANLDAFSCKWAGASQASPKYEAGDMNMAVKWAIDSAIQPSRTGACINIGWSACTTIMFACKACGPDERFIQVWIRAAARQLMQVMMMYLW